MGAQVEPPLSRPDPLPQRARIAHLRMREIHAQEAGHPARLALLGHVAVRTQRELKSERSNLSP